MRAGLADALTQACTATQLKEACRERRMPVSGAKPALAQRLVDGDPRAAEDLLAGGEWYRCTAAGAAVALRRQGQVDAWRAEAVAVSLSCAKRRDYAGARRAADAFNASHVAWPQGEALPLLVMDDRDPVAVLRTFSESRPGLLGSLPKETWERLRVAACMWRLWHGKLEHWLGDPAPTFGRFTPSQVVTVLVHAEAHFGEADTMARVGIARVDLVPEPDACPACTALGRAGLPVGDLPELPNPRCTRVDRPCVFIVKPVLDS